jgi:hypothetical protein
MTLINNGIIKRNLYKNNNLYLIKVSSNHTRERDNDYPEFFAKCRSSCKSSENEDIKKVKKFIK